MSFGRLERTQGATPMSDINVTPLVDVMLVLVVIFILTAPLLVSSIKVDLPKAQAGGPSQAPSFIVLVLDKKGQVFLNDKTVLPAQLAQQLSQTAAQNPDTEVQLRVDSSVPYGQVLNLMDSAQKAGLTRIGFVAQPQSTSPKP